jgi:ubiquinone/menaquinone biosynthesis C-methylase UbiE
LSIRLSPLAAHALWAATYDRDANPLVSLEERTVEPLLPASMAGQVTVDVACGTGRWLTKLERRGARVVGLDLSPEMLHQASAKPALGTRLIQADCVAIPLRDSSADLAILSLGLGYVEDLSGLAKELARVLRPEGQLILSDFHPEAQARGWKRSFRHGEKVVEISSFPRTLDCIRDAFCNENFRLVRCIEQPFGEVDRPLFDQCGRPDLFRRVLGQVAIFVCVFRRAQDIHFD